MRGERRLGTDLIVVTGGPCAGKTAVLELAQKDLCSHVAVLPEAASIVLGGGFPRRADEVTRRATQRAIYHVQRELERTVEPLDVVAALCDRGTLDGLAYWPGRPAELLDDVGSTLDRELARYTAVVHLRVPHLARHYKQTPIRRETYAEARAVDERLLDVWARHPRRVVIDGDDDFLRKAREALAALRDLLRDHTCGGR